MSKRDAFGDEVEIKNKSDFSTLFEESLGSIGRKLSTGDPLSVELLSIGREESFVSTGTPTDAMILTSELLDENKQLKYKVGDRLEVVVVKTKGGEIRVAKKGSRQSNADLDSLEDAFDMELPVAGTVTEVVNGGFRVSVQNKLAFCPISQMDYKIGDAAEYIGKKFDFVITKFEASGRNIVVSRRKLLDLEKAENEGQFLTSAQQGDIYQGTVMRMEKFGAFVKLESGVEGLVHISEIGWSRLQDPSEVLALGQKVQVKLLKSEEIDGRLKVSLSIKQAGGESDPWTQVTDKFRVGTVHEGTVEKKEVYGLFVNLAPGITGLLPKSKWRDSIDHQSFEARKRGDKIKVSVDEVLFEQKRISLGVAVEVDDQAWRATENAKSGFSNSGLGGLGDLLKKR